MTSVSKAFIGDLLDRKLKEIGIKGKYRYTDTDPSGNAAMLSSIVFEDPKDEFIYHLHGGDKLWDFVWDSFFTTYNQHSIEKFKKEYLCEWTLKGNE
jgi:hypothetical protein